jgi:CRISPR system Cascade subunit CasE
MPKDFYLLDMLFNDDRLMRRATARNLPMRDDTGYLVHMQLGELFGEMVPKPFRIDRIDDQLIRVLAYSDHPASILKVHAEALAELRGERSVPWLHGTALNAIQSPLIHSICDWQSFTDKPMPNIFKPGQRFGFELRACPVVRLAKAGIKITRDGDKIQVKKGAEVDVFIQQAWARPDEKLSRETIYREWLEGQFKRRGGARLTGFRLKSFRCEKLIRRDHAARREAHQIKRPDAQIDGEIEITDSKAFTNMLRAGLGRHRGFGFGMLVLRD